MKIAVLSGKGGTGKTLISTNLANVIKERKHVELLDCDVEEPNSSLFFNIKFEKEVKVNLDIPLVDNEICNKCGICAQKCQFGAINSFPTGTLVFETLCHGCSVCSDVCPVNAIKTEEKDIGIIKYGAYKNINFGEGVLNIGKPSGVKIIKKLKHFSKNLDIQILDSPPGASCSVVETLKNVDFALLVTEPTPFGLHDLKAVQEIVSLMEIEHAIVINKYESEYEYKEMNQFIKEKNLKVIQKIPFSNEIAKIYSKSELISENEKYKKIFEEIAEKVGVYNV